MATAIITRIDKEVHKHRLVVSGLRTQRNSYLPVFRLPPETLANIFILGARDYYENSDHATTLRVPCWVDVSYVCRYWRAVALDCGTLWSYHFTVSLPWTEELLVRSKQASLKIRIQSFILATKPLLQDVVGKLLSHSERIQELCLHVGDTVLPSTLCLDASRLQILDINGPWGDSFSWTLTISDGRIPPLCILRLYSCPVPWNSLSLSGLTTLFLHHIPFHSQQNIPEFLATLRHTQALTILDLQHALPSARSFLSSGDFRCSPKVSLHRLTRLSVAAPLLTVVALLSCVNIPLKTQVRLGCECEDNYSIDDYAQIYSVLGQRFTGPSKPLSSFSPTIRAVTMCFSMSSTLALRVSEDNDTCDPPVLMEFPHWDCNIPLVVIVRMEESMWHFVDRIASGICCSIPLTDVQVLQIINPPPEIGNLWRETLGRLPGLRHLKLKDHYIHDLKFLLTAAADEPMETRCGDASGDRNRTPGRTLVPGLEELTLERLNFGSQADYAHFQNMLIDALSTRKTRPRLAMIKCRVYEEE